MNTTYHLGDARRVLRELEAGSVDLIVSSPPFLALRSYLPADHPDKPYEIGSESTPGEFLDVLLDVVEECARVLAPHGSLCFELGDTYAGSGGAGGDYTNDDGLRAGQNVFDGSARRNSRRDKVQDTAAGVLGTTSGERMRANPDGWPQAKSLCLIPQSFAFALSYGRNPHTGRTTDPWRVRNIVRWWRPNPPVGALGDKWRPATSEITIACKSARRYWDDIATRVAPVSGEPGEMLAESRENIGYSGRDKPGAPGFSTQPHLVSHAAGAPMQDTWRIPTAPYKGSHYATYPPALVEPLIKAMAPPRVCRVCGEPSRRIVKKSDDYAEARAQIGDFKRGHTTDTGLNGTEQYHNGKHMDCAELETVGWTDCGHDDWRRAVILDPFAGTGTTLMVANGHGHDAIGIDLDARNADLARERLGMFLEVVA